MDKTRLYALYQEDSRLEKRIAELIQKKDDTMIAMVNLRGVRDEGQTQCVNGRYQGQNPVLYHQKLYKAEYDVAGANYQITGVFDSDVIKSAEAFLAVANTEKIRVCAKDAPRDSVLKKMQNQTNSLMLSAIYALIEQRKMISHQIRKIENK